MLREKGGGGGLHVSAPIARTAPPALRGLETTTDRSGRRGAAHLWLAGGAWSSSFKRERELSERGNEGGERERTLKRRWMGYTHGMAMTNNR